MAEVLTFAGGLGVQGKGDTEVLTFAGGVGVQGKGDTLSSSVQYLRATWMRKMGATQEDIDEYCNLVRHPGSVSEELENLRDLDQLNLKNLPRADLEALSRRFSKPPTR
jgi:hypothetical protein